MNFAMVTAAQRYREFIAYFAAKRRALREAHVMGVRWLPAADQARLLGNETDVIAVADPPRLREGKHALVDFFGAPLPRRPKGLSRAPGFRRCGFIDGSANVARCWLIDIWWQTPPVAQQTRPRLVEHRPSPVCSFRPGGGAPMLRRHR